MQSGKSGIEFGDVPCNGCVKCCQGDAVRILPEDDASQYETEPHFAFPGELMLAHKENGDCVYLTATGCGIHENKPLMCRKMDCRNVYKAVSFRQAQAMKALKIWRQGQKLIKTNKGEAR